MRQRNTDQLPVARLLVAVPPDDSLLSDIQSPYTKASVVKSDSNIQDPLLDFLIVDGETAG